MGRRWAFVAVFSLVALSSCSASPPAAQILSDAAVTHAPRPWPTAMIAAPDARPRILAIQLNETTIANGTHWRGRIATTTNVASVEVRTESFSFAAQRTTFGQFAFDVHVLDLPPQYRRAFLLAVIARSASGAREDRYIPIRFL